MDRQARADNLDHFYELLWQAQQKFDLHSFADIGTWRANPRFPRAGVYFVFEKGEMRAGRSDWQRVVRVGTHWVSTVRVGSKADLPTRLGNHYGSADGSRGANSVFRVHLGSALAGGQPEWWLGADRAELPIDTIGAIQSRISHHMREKMSFVVVPIDDLPSKRSLRRVIEMGAISLLSNFHSELPDAIDPPSRSWLGRKCISKRDAMAVSKSGLWNVDGVRQTPDVGFLSAMRSAIEA